MALVTLEPAASLSRVKHSTTEPLRSQEEIALWMDVCTDNMPFVFVVACFYIFLKKRVDKNKMPSKLFS